METIFRHKSSLARHSEGGALVLVMIFIVIMAASVAAVHTYTTAVMRSTGNNGEFLRENAAAEAAAEVVIGRMIQWVTANNGDGPSIADCGKTGVNGNSNFPAINSAIIFPSSSTLSDYTVSTPTIYPMLPDDSYVTDPTDPKYLPDFSARQSISDNSSKSVTKYYYTTSTSLNAKTIQSRSMTYRISVTVTPKTKTLKTHGTQTITRYLRCDKVSPFAWCTYRFGSTDYDNSHIYQGPMYIAKNVGLYRASFTDSVLYGGTASASKNGDGTYVSQFLGGGYNAQVKQSALLSLVPNLVANLATSSTGKRAANYETSLTPLTSGGPLPADTFSQRELIEPPSNPANDTTPSVIAEARIYNQADVRIKVSVANSVVSKSVVDVKGNTVDPTTNSWVTPLLNAVNVKTTDDAVPFYDTNRSAANAVEVTDINVGALKVVMDANPTVFTTGIIYAWDTTGLDSTGAATSSRPLTGVRVWNAGELPDTGLVLGTNDPVYLKGDFNSGAKMASNATINDSPTVQPPTNSSSWLNNNATSASDRIVSGYTVKPGGVFGDAVTELSNSWKDASSLSTQKATSTTINLVEGWTTNLSNQLNADDSYNTNKANPIWVEDWNSARRTMSGEEFVVWHSRYNLINKQSGGGWKGDISYDRMASNLKLNWGVVNFVRDRVIRDAAAQ